MATDLIFFIGALVVLILCGRLIVQALTGTAKHFGISEYAMAFVLLAVATSTPELFVSISSAYQEAGDLVLATTLGSNVINMTFIVGAAAVISLGIATTGLNLRRDVLIGGAITILPLILLHDGLISRLEGVLLLTMFLLYLVMMYRDGNNHSPARSKKRDLGRGFLNVVLVLGLVAILVYASNVVVTSALGIAQALHIPEFLIGIFALAFGTSLPELTTTLHAALMRRPSLALGTILGSNVADSALIIGIASLVRPLSVSLNPLLITTAILVVISVAVLGWFAVTHQRISTREGLFLLLLFGIFGLLLVFFGVPGTGLVA